MTLRHKSDFLVIGAGIGGLSFALKAAEHGSVMIVTKGSLGECNTSWAQGGIASVLQTRLRESPDSCESHIQDTKIAGAGLCNEVVVQAIVNEGKETIDELIAYGVEFDQTDGQFDLGKEGGHSQRRVLHSKDTTGKAIMMALVARVRAHRNITLMEHFFTVDLITCPMLGAVTQDRVVGAYVLDLRQEVVHAFRSDRVVLATGGCGKVYLYTTNPDSATGDGVAIAWRAGAKVSNMEFIQFHPTCFYNPAANAAEERSFLISEAVRGEGGVLCDGRGHPFMDNYDERGSLAPRDIVARAIDQEIKRTGGDCMYLDATGFPEGFFSQRFPFIYENLKRYNHDPEQAPIPIVPAAHYQCGGVVTDSHGRTSIYGLYAVGEVAHTGLHGANRLASNSLLEANVMARRAYYHVVEALPVGKKSEKSTELAPWNASDLAPPDELVNIYHNWDEVRRLMWDYVSIVRTENRLKRASVRLRNLQREVIEFYWGYQVNQDILELRNLVTVASLIVEGAQLRRESRGLHFRLDCPVMDQRQKRDTMLQLV